MMVRKILVKDTNKLIICKHCISDYLCLKMNRYA